VDPLPVPAGGLRVRRYGVDDPLIEVRVRGPHPRSQHRHENHGTIGPGALVPAISAAITGLSDDELLLMDTPELIDAASSLPVDVFAKQIRREAERVHGDSGLGDTKLRQARSSWKHWFDERAGMGHVHGEFDPERYEAIIGSVEVELTRMANEGGVTKDSRLAADAAFGLLTGRQRSRSGRPHISVVVDWETFSRGRRRSPISNRHRRPMAGCPSDLPNLRLARV